MTISMGDYLKLIGNCQRLTAAEEYAAWESGDTESLIRSQLPFVVNLARRVSIKYGFHDVELLVSSGNERLVLAVRSFRPSTGFRLSTYISRAVYGTMQQEVERLRDGCTPARSARRNNAVVSHAESLELGRLAVDWREPDVDARLLSQEDSEQVAAALGSIGKLPRDVLRLWSQSKTLREIADELGITQDCAANYKRRYLQKLQRRAKAGCDFREMQVNDDSVSLGVDDANCPDSIAVGDDVQAA